MSPSVMKMLLWCAALACAVMIVALSVVPPIIDNDKTALKPDTSVMYVKDVEDIDPLLIEYRNRRAETMYDPGSRGLVCELHPKIGLANRMMHMTSCVALSVLTDRALYFDWDEYTTPILFYVYYMAVKGEDPLSRSSYQSLFQTFFSDVGTTGHDLEQKGSHNTLDLPFLATDYTAYNRGMQVLGSDDMNAVFDTKTLYVTGWNFWGKALFANPWYQGTALASLGSERFFCETCKALFKPRFEYSLPGGCQWVIQYRSHHGWYTAPVESFQRCATRHGFINNAKELNLLISDQQVTIPGFISLDTGCRTGFQCDIQAVHQIYLASKCKNAVLTSKSTYGQVAAAIGNISMVWMVREDGTCVRKKSILPDHEE